MNVKDGSRKVQAHDRGCPNRVCYDPLLMAIVGSEDIWQCGGWDGNEEPCSGKMPTALRYCGKCELVTIKHISGQIFYEWICDRYKKVLTQKGKRHLKCNICCIATRLEWKKEHDNEN
jgi:hypothetical protein